jgi:hypothetical protein
LSQPLIANIQGLKELKEGGEVDMVVPPPTSKIEEKDQQGSLQGVKRELGTLRIPVVRRDGSKLKV